MSIFVFPLILGWVVAVVFFSSYDTSNLLVFVMATRNIRPGKKGCLMNSIQCTANGIFVRLH